MALGGGDGQGDVLPDSPEPIAGGGEPALRPETRAIVHTDGYSAYGRTRPRRRQLCLAHEQRQAKAMLER